MQTREQLEGLFVGNLPTIDRIISGLARRHALDADTAEEFGAWAKAQIIENDYAVLAKFRGESSLATYLTIVVSTLLRQYRVTEFGRWRPSAAARHHGELGVRLERLTQRDGMPVRQAAQMLRTAGNTALSDGDLARLVATFPRRSTMKRVDEGGTRTDIPAESRADDRVDASEVARERRAIQQAIAKLFDTFTPEDRLVIQLRYVENLSIAEIARGLALTQKPLYRRLERLLEALRTGLERSGISLERIRALITEQRL